MEELTIIKETETNEFYNPSTCHNGGGYSQPLCEFEFNGKKGIFEDTSCGEFGTRYSLEFDGKRAYWGSMVEERCAYSTFTNKDNRFFKAFFDEFDYVDSILLKN